MNLFAKVARRTSASFFAIGYRDDEARLVAVVEHLGRLLHGGCQGRAALRRQSIHRAHYGLCGVRRWLEIEMNVALVVGPRTISDEAHATKLRGARQDLGERVPRFIYPRDGGPDALPHVPGHRTRCIEYNHGVFVARRRLRLLGADSMDVASRSRSQRDCRETNGKKPIHAMRSMGPVRLTPNLYLRLTQRCLGDHRAVEGLLQRLYKLILAVGLDIEAAILFGHAHQVHDAVLPCPRVALVSKGNDVNGKLVASGMELLAELTRRPSASLFTVGDDDDDARLVAEVERLGCLLDALCQRRFSGRNDPIHCVHDGKSGICRRLELEFDVALVVRSRTVGHEADATKFGGVRQYSGKSGSCFVDPGSGVRDAEGLVAGH